MSQGSAATVELVVVNGGPDDIEALTETLRAGGVPVGVAGTEVVAVPVWVAGTDTVVPGVPDNAGTRTLTAAINTWRQRRQSEAGLEVVAVHDSISVRNTGDPESPVLYFSRSEWAAFVAGVKNGEFDDHVSPGTGSSQPSATETFEVGVFLGDGASHEEVIAAVEHWLEEAGLEIVERVAPVIGSYCQSFKDS